MHYKGIVLSDYISWQNLDDIFLIVDERKNQKYILEGTSQEIMLMIVAKKSVNYIVNALVNKYCVTKEIIKKDVYAFLKELIDIEVIKVEKE